MATAIAPLQETSLASITPARVRNRVYLVGALTASACAPLLLLHCVHLWERPHYQFFPIVFIGAAVLAWTRWPDAERLHSGSRTAGWTLIGIALLLLTAGELLYSPWLGAVAFCFVLLAASHAIGGAVLVKSLLPAWLFLWLMIPLPLALDQMFVQGLQRLTSSWSSAVLDHLGIFHMIAGNVVEIGGRRLFVEQACAGINSLYATLTCTLFYVLLTRVPVIRATLLVVMSASWVLLANVSRVCIIAWGARRDIDLAEGWRHDVLGYSLFAVALGLIWSTDRLLLFLGSSWRAPVSPAPSSAEAVITKSSSDDLVAALGRSWLGAWASAALFGSLLGFHLFCYVLPVLPRGTETDVPLDKLTEATLPTAFDTWKRGSFEEKQRSTGSAFGEFSKSWTYHRPGQGATFSVDYPFGYWHELQECYRGHGWELQTITDHAEQKDAPAFYREMRFTKAGMRFGHLFYCQFDQTGRVIPRERGLTIAPIVRHESALHWGLTWLDTKTTRSPGQVGALIQFQLFTESQSPLPAEEIEKSRQHYFKAWELVQRELLR